MCLALNERPFTKERKKEEESITRRRSGTALKKNIMKPVNSCKFKIVYKHCLICVYCRIFQNSVHHIRRLRQTDAV